MKNPWFALSIEAAKAGSDVAARKLLRYLAECLERGEVPPEVVAKYFATAFKQIASGRKANDELHLGKNTHFERDYAIAWEVWELNQRGMPLRVSDKKEGAFDVVGKKQKPVLSADRIQQIYWDMKGLIEAELFQMSLADGEDREGPELSVKVRRQLKEVHRRFEVDDHIASGELVEALKKQKQGSD
ncbi:hypothetical protein NVV94_05240 [Pseudomonas sp. LS1212]|uniref:hypothetical protein n=1 Tax=Pseudomonas sp. LS1212 TaxID=2972478 RepID=UPI00215CAB5A|nr:hypothetical protein [Pseudomonas sp. LS1212]UVJ44988.1 hypothetical protein NVV94_05240 [Pseudomonas sp. LS1212]